MGLFDNLTYAYGSEPGANTNLELRRRIALSMLSGKKGFPKNLGEGLSAIGDAIGDRGLMSRVEREDAQAQAAARALGAGLSGGSPSTNAAPVVNEGPDAETPRALTPVEPNQPSAMLGEDSRMPGAYTPPDQQPSSLLSPKSELGGTAPRLASGSFTPPAAPAPLAADAGYNSLDAAAGAPQPGQPGVTPQRFATVRNNNPGGAYPTKDAADFGSTGSEIIGGGHPIAKYPTPVHGAAANMALLARNYVGMPVSAAISKWSGGGRTSVPGFDPNAIVTPEMARDPKFMQAIAGGEAPGQYPMSPEQWQMASQWAGQGRAPAAEGGPRDVAAATLAARQQNAPVMAYAPPTDVQSDAPPIGFQPSPQRDAIAQTMAGSTPATAGVPAPDTRLAQASTVLPSYRPGPPPAPAVARPAQAPAPTAQVPARPEGRPVPPLAPVPVPMSRDEARLEQLKIDNQNNPYAAPQIDRMLGPIKAAREAENARRVEEYKAKLQHHNALDLDYVQNTAKRQREDALAPYALQKAKNEAAAGERTVVDGRLMAPDPTKPPGSPWVDITAPAPGSKAGGPPQINMSKEQADNVKFLTQMYTSSAQLKGKEKLLADGLKDEMAGKVPFVGNSLLSRDYRLAKRAAEFWVAANLRDVSGAVIGTKEHADQMKWLMPQYGDDDAALREKEARRNSVISGMYGGLGKAQPAADYAKQQVYDTQADMQKKINEEMSHLGDKPVGYVARNKKTGSSRVWNGKNWLEM